MLKRFIPVMNALRIIQAQLTQLNAAKGGLGIMCLGYARRVMRDTRKGLMLSSAAAVIQAKANLHRTQFICGLFAAVGK